MKTTLLTEAQMIKIMDTNSINKCTKSEQDQIFRFAFGDEFMESDDKGKKKVYH